MTDYEKLYYESQAQLANLADELKGMALDIQRMMRQSEEKILSENEDVQNEQNEQKKRMFVLHPNPLTFSKTRGIIIKLSDERAKLGSLKARSLGKIEGSFGAIASEKQCGKSGIQPDGSQGAGAEKTPNALASESKKL